MTLLEPSSQETTTLLLACYRSTSEAFVHGFDFADSESKVILLKILTACSETCRSTAILLLQNQYLHWDACATTAELCLLTARHCLEFTTDPVLQACAEVCRKCAKLCYQQSKLFYMEEVPAPHANFPKAEFL
jgi:hypothetical protein